MMNPWLVKPRPNPQATLRLFCFPYAGGGSSIYRTWPEELPANVELVAVELPGRDTRFKDAPFDRLATMVPAVADALADELRAPFAIYGHSMGALIGFALTRELRRRKVPAPRHLFVSGRRAPQFPEPDPMFDRSDAAFLEGLRRLGGISEAVLQEEELMAIFSPILRADFAIGDTAVIAAEEPLDVPISVLGGLTDERASVEELHAWGAQTRAAFDVETFTGGHFFLHSERAALLRSLARRLAAVVAEPARL
jgi:medium-chain acyl-[acyl-carrier-protein] hydrolase